MKLRRLFAAFLALVLVIDASPLGAFHATAEEAAQPDTVISAVNAEKLLHSATIEVAETYLGRTDQQTIGADQPTIETLASAAPDQFNASGQEWNWFAYKVTAAEAGTYTLGVQTAGSKYDAYQLPLCVNGGVYALQYTEKAQLATAEVTLPAGEYVVVVFMPLPAAEANITGNVWNDYHWCDIESVTVDAQLTVSLPTAAEVEACFPSVADTVIPATDTNYILRSAATKHTDGAAFIERDATAGLYEDDPRIDTLLALAPGQFNASGTEWPWMAYKITVPADGTYTLGVSTQSAKYSSFKIPMVVNHEVYTLSFTAKGQTVTAEVDLLAGEYVVTVFWPMPANESEIQDADWNTYQWANIASVTVDRGLTVGNAPTAAEVEAAVIPNKIFNAIDDTMVLYSAAMGNNGSGYLEFNSRDAVKADAPYIGSLLEDAPGEFNKSGEEWGWIAYKVTAPADGVYTLKLQNQSCRNAPYDMPLYVNGQIYTLSYPATGRQTATVNVTLTAGGHTVVIFMPMPKNAESSTGTDYVDYPWANPERITADARLTVSLPTVEEVEACFPVDPIIPAVNTQKILHSATIQVADTYLGRTDQNAIGADLPTIDSLYTDASGQFNVSGQEWNWFAYKVNVPEEGTYTLGVQTSGSKYDAYQLPLCVNGQVYALQFTEKAQLATAEVTLPAGEHVVVMFMPMPAAEANITGNVWNDYHWCNVESVMVDPKLTVSLPTVAEVEACFALETYSAVDTGSVLWSGAVKHTEGTNYVERGSTTGVHEDTPRIDTLLALAHGNFNESGKEWLWIAYKVSIPKDGTYTLGITTNNCKYASYKLPMVVNGQIHTLSFTEKAQTVTTEVDLPAGEHVVTVFWPMPEDESKVDASNANNYLWCNIEAVKVDYSLTVTAPTAAEVEACFPPVEKEDTIISAPDTNYILYSAAVKYVEGNGFLERGDNTAGLYEDDPRIDTLWETAPGQFNASGTEWPWMAYKITAPADGTYTLGVTTQNCKWASFKLPMVVNNEIYTLTFTEKAQTVTAEVTLPAGEHVVTVFWPMPANSSEVDGSDWNSYPWCNMESVTVAHELTVSKPTEEEVEACFPAPAYTRVEAEDTQYVIHNNYHTPNESNAAASGGTVVGGAWNSTYKQTFAELEKWLSFKGNAYVEYAVMAPADGEYDIRVGFLAGSSDKNIAKPYIAVVVNETTYQAQFTKNWNEIDKVKLTVKLKEGLNIIRCTSMTTEQEIYGARGWINHDFLDLDTRLTPVKRSAVTAEAENSEYFNNFKVQAGGEAEAASGDVLGSADRSYITAQKLTLDQLTETTLKQIPYFSFTVTAPQNGYYPIRVAMSSDGRLANSTVGMIVDGQVQAVEYTRTDKTTAGAMVETVIYLTKGDHVLTFTTPMPAAADPEANYSYYWANFDYVTLYDGLVLSDEQKAPTPEKDSPLYGQSALFVGDSITHSENSWASKIGSWYNMDWTNAGVNGATVSDLRENIIRHQLMINAGKDYDYVIMHGGINDGAAEVGSVSESWNVADFDTSTYAGALETMFYYAYENFEGAKLGYIVNYATPNSDPEKWTGTQDMSAYFAEGKKVCEKWGISYIDLYFGSTADGKSYSYDILQVDENAANFLNNDPQEIHLSNQGYQVICPYIAQWMETLTEKESPIPAANSGKHIDTSDGEKVLYGGFTPKSEHTGTAALTGLQDRVYTGMAADQATVEMLPYAKNLLGNWAFASVAVDAAQDGEYTVQVEMAAKTACQMGMLVDGQVYTLDYSKGNGYYQFMEKTLPLTKGTHYITFTAAMPNDSSELGGDAWNIYPWTNITSVIVDEGLQVLSKPTLENVTAELDTWVVDPVMISAVDSENILLSASIQKNENTLGRTDQETLNLDQPTVESLYADAYGQFNATGSEWNWFAYKLQVPAEGTYTLGVKTAGSKYASYTLPMIVNGNVYALQYTENAQLVTAEVKLPAGEHVVVVFMPMPATGAELTGNAWNDYHWCDVESVAVDVQLTVSKPDVSEVEACFPAPAYTRVEAEDTQYVIHNNYHTPNESNAAASGGTVVGGAWNSTYKQTFAELEKWLSFKGNAYVEYAVMAPADGEYDIRVGFLAGSSDKNIAKPYIAVVVNETTYQAQFTKNWNQIDKVKLTVSLKEGLNIIRCTSMTTEQEIYGAKGWINHDFLDLDTRLTPVKRSTVTVEAENSEYINNFKVQAGGETEAASDTVLGSANTAYVKDKKLTLNQLTATELKNVPYVSFTVTAPQNGYYPIRVAMSSDGRLANSTVGMIVDGQVQAVEYTRTDKTTAGAMVETLIYLTKGDHVLTFTTPMPATADPEANYGYYWANFDYVMLYDGLVLAQEQRSPVEVEEDDTVYTRVEAENTEYVLYNNYNTLNESNEDASGGTVVGGAWNSTYKQTFAELEKWLSFKGNAYVEYAVMAPADGEYDIRVGFLAGSSDKTIALPYIAVIVNDTTYKAQFAQYWNEIDKVKLTVSLKEGLNIIRCTSMTTEQEIYGAKGWINHDFLDLDTRLTPVKHSAITVEAENSEYINNFKVQAGGETEAASGTVLGSAKTAYVKDKKLTLDQLTATELKNVPYVAFTVTAPQNGYYPIRVAMSSDGRLANSTVGMIVDGQVQAVEYTRTDKTTAGAMVETLIYLTKGDHVLTFTTPMPATADPEANYGYYWANFDYVTLYDGLVLAQTQRSPVEVEEDDTVYTRVEAENTEYVLYNNYNTLNESNEDASGGTVVGGAWNSTYKQTFAELEKWLSFKGNAYVEYAVMAPADGEYDIRVGFLAGSNDKTIALPYIAVIVNDTTYKAQFTQYWNEIDSVKLTVSLKEGLNIIRCTSMTTEQEIYGAKGWINHDFLDLDTRLTPVKRSTVTVEAENSEYINNFKVQAGGETEAASGTVLGSANTAYVKDKKLTLDQLTATELKNIPYVAFTVTAPQNGYYPIRVAMSSDGRLANSTVGMIVDGKTYAVAYTRTDKTTAGAMVETLIYLTKGDHVLTFTTPMPATADPEANYGYYWANFDYVMLYDGLVLAQEQRSPVEVEADDTVYTRVEAENTEYVLYNNYNTLNESNEDASGGTVVGGAWNSTYKQTFAELEKWLSFKGNAYVEYAVVAPADGEYDIRVGFLAGSSDKTIALPYIAVIVNDTTYKAQFTQYWNEIDSVKLTVSLKEGLNIIRCTSMTTEQEIYGVRGWINHDFLDVDSRLTPVKRSSPVVMEAEDSKYFEKLTVQAGGETEEASGSVLGSAERTYIKALELTLDQLTQSTLRQVPYFSFTVSAPQNGYYPIRVAMSSDGRLKNSTVGMIVDGQAQAVEYTRTDKTSKGAMVETLVYLTKGEHVITFTTPIPATAGLEVNYSYYWANFDYVMLYDGLELAQTQKAPTTEPEYVRIEVEDHVMFNMNKNNGSAAGNAYYKCLQSVAEILESGIDGSRTPYVELTVQANSAGSYVLYAGVSVGMTEASTLEEADVPLVMEVNGTLQTQWVHATKSTNYTILPLRIDLNEGINTVRLTHLSSDAQYGGTTWIDFDYMEMPGWVSQQIAVIKPGETLEAELARFDGFGESVGSGYSGGRYLGRANYDTVAEVNITYDTMDPANLNGVPYVTYRVFAEKAGTYAVSVGFAAGLTNYTNEEIKQGVAASFVAIVNGETKQRVEFMLGSPSTNMTRMIMLELKEGENDVTITGTTTEYVIDRIPRNDETYRLVWIDQDYLTLSAGLSNLGQDVDPFDIEDSDYDFSQIVPREPSETPQPGGDTPAQSDGSVIVWTVSGVGIAAILLLVILLGKKKKKKEEQ